MFAGVFFGIIGLGLAAAAVLHLPLTWDGAYYFFNVLFSGEAFTPHERLINAPLQAPTQLVSFLSDDVDLLQLIFSLAYAAVPFACLFACWRIARRMPGLFLWPVIGIGLIGLPGAANMTSEAVLAVDLAWPIVMAATIGLDRRNAGIAVACSAALIFAHPFAIPLLGGVAAALLVRGWTDAPEREESWIWAAGFACLTMFALIRFLIFRDVYEGGQLSIGTLQFQFAASVLGWPLIALMLAAVGSAVVAVPSWFRWRSRVQLASAIAAMTILAAGVMLGAWASDASNWDRALEFRGWYLWLSLPVMALAFMEGTFRPDAVRDTVVTSSRLALSVFVGIIFAVVLTLQGAMWNELLGRLTADVRASREACISASSLPWTDASPLHHWSITPLSISIQGKIPVAVVLEGTGCATADLREGFPIGGFDRREWSSRWFDLVGLGRLVQLEADGTGS